MARSIDRLIIWVVLPAISAGAVVLFARREIGDRRLLVVLGLVAALGTFAISRREHHRLGSLQQTSLLQSSWLTVRLLLFVLAIAGSVYPTEYVARVYWQGHEPWVLAIGLFGSVVWANLVSALRYPAALAVVPQVVVAALKVESDFFPSLQGMSGLVAVVLTGLCVVVLALTKMSYVPNALQPLRLFYSCSEQDDELRRKLESHLAVLRQNSYINEWHNRMIQPGQDRPFEIDQNLEAADIILLLVSADFLASSYCYNDEMERALQRREEREAEVVPVLLRPCDWESAPFGHLQPVPTNGHPVKSSHWAYPDEAFENIARNIREIVERRWRQGRLY